MLYGFVDSAYLSKFLWKDAQPVVNRLFPKNSFGLYVLTRGRVMKKIKKAMASQLELDTGEAPVSTSLSVVEVARRVCRCS